MAYVIAEPCIGTKDTACVDAARLTAFIRTRTKMLSKPRLSFTLTRSSASIAALVSRFVRRRRSSLWMILPEKWKHFAEINANHLCHK